MSTIIRSRRKQAKTNGGMSAPKKAILMLITLAVLGAVTATAVVAGAYSYYTRELPSPEKLQNRQVFRSTKILDRNGRLLYELFDPTAGKRTYVRLPEISKYLVQATVAIEDDTFYDNPGISPRGTLRAILANLRGEEVQGGSTITQQLIKQVLLTSEVTVDRKIQEWILAYRVNQQYTKDQVLEWYLNEIFYGNMAYGVEAAAEAYFGKDAENLDLAEASMLAGVPQAPALLSPLIDPMAARRRQRMVLDAMVKNGYVTAAQAEAAAGKPLDYKPMRYGLEAPHFVMYVRSLLEQRYGPRLLYSGGLTVRTTVDLDMQHLAERSAREQVAKLDKYNIHNAALVALRPTTGEILAMVGSVDYFDRSISGQVNISTAERQPGSAFKPITYSASFLKGWTPGTVILDDYTIFFDRLKRPYTPKNVDNKWHGPVTVRKALGNSMNIPAVKALQFVGVNEAIELAHQMGITSLQNQSAYDLSLTLGGGEVKLLDLVYAFSVFANGGALHGQPIRPEAQRPGYRTVDPVAILSVEDDEGRVLDEFAGPSRAEVLKPRIAYLMTSILSDDNARLPLFAPNGPLKLSRPAAAKTGTTENNRDLWTVGYTPDLVAGVWVGNSDNQEIAPVLSTMTAAPIWHDFMEQALAGVSPKQFDVPGGLERVEICPLDGLKPNQFCPTKVTEVFIKGTAPTKECTIHRQVTVDKRTGELATPSTPPSEREDKVIEVYPPEWQAWAKAAGKEEPPKAPGAQDPSAPPPPLSNREGNSTFMIASPATGAAVRGEVEIRGTATGKGFASYRVEFGEGLNPTTWSPIGGSHTGPVENGVLEKWDAKSLNGLYRLRITLFEQAVSAPTAAPARPGQPGPTPAPSPTPTRPLTKVLELPVIVDNTPPTVTVTFPSDNADLKQKEMERLTLTAQVSDNHRIARTEFFVDGKPAGSSASTPATLDWPTATGAHVIRAVARDAAGNEARSSDVKIVIR